MYSTLKLIHICAAILTVSGFMLRGFWMLRSSSNLDQPLVRIVPHIIDTAFLLSGIGLIWMLKLPVLDQPWLLAKFMALVAYVVFGAYALRRGKTLRVRATSFVLALGTFTYIAGVALTKSVTSWAAF